MNTNSERSLNQRGDTEHVQRRLGTILVTGVVSPLSVAVQLGDRQWHASIDAWWRECADTAAKANGRVIARPLDGLALLFDDPASALACALSIAEAGARHELPIQAGLHAGETNFGAELITGVAPLIAAMVAKQAQPGEIMATHTVRHIANDPGIAFEPAGVSTFPGLAVEWNLFRVGGQGSATLPSGRLGSAEILQAPARLSPRELEIASLLAAGLANREIAERLQIAPATVERHVANILMKLGFRSRAQVAGWMVEQGLFEPPNG